MQKTNENRYLHDDPRVQKLRGMLDGASIVITGGTGSFGQALAMRLLQFAKPARVIVFSRDEYKQFQMQTSPAFEGHDAMRYFLGDVRDADRLKTAFRDVDYVVHAAALKQVGAAEYNPFECIRTNVLGAENIVQAAVHNRIKRVVALSTDKAANPVNLYGASKLASDKIFVAGNHMSGSAKTRFSVVRYGNVIGSRGSVVPFFRRLVREGATSLPITDPRMTRFWITLQDGVDFVLSSLEMMFGGEIFIPKIPSTKIVDLASAIAPELPQRIVGIRPGEKVHEVMVTEDDSRSCLELPDRYILEPIIAEWQRGSHIETEGASRVADGFRYASDSNDQWLDVADLRALLERLGM
ncbi:MAG: UDP-N-acetylglucosamine 4,6-dehydratase (inverting) [Tagaea sp. CACIAM 22H2]|nr:UDP-N-acetylglucosamine 4,6-dehydratase (inverting) [Tagaea sp. CACIAM 22H2]